MLLGLAKTLFSKKKSSEEFLYVTGSFTTANGVTVNRVAKWDGENFVGLGSAGNYGVNSGTVYALASDNDGNIYVGGNNFTSAGGVTANRIAKWDGSSWSAIGPGFNGGVYTIAVDDDGTIYAGGFFTKTGDNSTTVNGIAKWNGTSWSSLGGSVDGQALIIDMVLDSESNLYVGGDIGSFRRIGGVVVNNVAKWNGTSWSALANGVSASVNSLAIDPTSGNVHMVGSFSTLWASGGYSNRQTKKYTYWDGSQLVAPTTGNFGLATFSTGESIAIHPSLGEKYMWAAQGYFYSVWDDSGGPPTDNGDIFSASPHGALNNNSRATAFDSDGNVYLGGDFTTANGVTVNRLAKWDGTSWSAFGTGLNDRCRRIIFAP